jgi:hypothetical protein
MTNICAGGAIDRMLSGRDHPVEQAENEGIGAA